jgi:adenylate kinase
MIILMGVAGAGKSTQGRLFADEYGVAWISTGELLRVVVTGRRRREMSLGKLLSDEEMITIMDKIFSLINTQEQCILDGFPRTVAQSAWLLNQASNGRFDIGAVFNLLADHEVLRKRLLARGRMDDTDQAITERFEEYDRVTKPIIATFVNRGTPVYTIDANQSPRQVHEQMKTKLTSLGLIELL